MAAADHLGQAQVDVLAHSAGTRVALALSARHPQRVRRLILVTPSAAWLTGSHHDGNEVAAARSDQDIIAPAMEALASEPGDQRALDEYRRVTAPAGYAAWQEREQTHAEVGSMGFVDYRAFFTSIPDDAAARILARPLPPCLVIAGEQDILSGVSPVKAFASALGAELAWIPDCGHYPWVEQPERFSQAVSAWLHPG